MFFTRPNARHRTGNPRIPIRQLRETETETERDRERETERERERETERERQRERDRERLKREEGERRTSTTDFCHSNGLWTYCIPYCMQCTFTIHSSALFNKWNAGLHFNKFFGKQLPCLLWFILSEVRLINVISWRSVIISRLLSDNFMICYAILYASWHLPWLDWVNLLCISIIQLFIN